ncbi:MAG: DUF58 domain-containing protein [Planctomycetota bacterium]|jgi:uncharacterized protein (DUF58 family)
MRARANRFRIDPPILLYVGITFVMGLGALISQNNLLYFAFGLALAVLMVSGVVTAISLNRLQVHRLSPPTATIGEAITIRYRLTNRSRLWPACAMRVREVRSRRDASLRELDTGFVSIVRPGQWRVAHVSLDPLRRGAHTLERIRISTRFPFGVLHKSLEIRKPDEMLVRPAPTKPSEDVLRAIEAQRIEHRGMTRARNLDEDVVFASLREFSPGDSIRQIAWKPSARRDRLLIRQSTSMGGSQLLIVLLLYAPNDQVPEHVGAGREEINEDVISLGAGVLGHATATGFRVGLAIPAIEHLRMPHSRTIDARRWESTLLDDLARVRLEDVRSVAQAGWRMPRDIPTIIVRAPGAEGPDGHAGVASITPHSAHRREAAES